VSFGKAELLINMRQPAATREARGASLWFSTNDVDAIHAVLKSAQLSGVGPEIAFVQEIEDMFYGARQFGIRDRDGHPLYFIQTSA
jgi:uncharacterized glyoxalase superfamily protein PhnB